MKLVEFVPPVPHPLWKLCPQMGITDVIVKVNPELTGLPDPWRYETLSSIVGRLASAGLRVVGLEGDPFDMRPIKEFGVGASSTGLTGMTGLEDHGNLVNHVNPVKNENELREEALAHYRELLESMGRLGIRLLCYNFMVGTGWTRTGVREGRGGAKATYFSLFTNDNCHKCSQIENANASAPLRLCVEDTNSREDLILTADQVWANYECFIKSVMPTAEKCGIRMALHPDDPCLPSLGGYARIFGSVEAFDRAYALHPSPSNAVTFCQANFKLMLPPPNFPTSKPSNYQTSKLSNFQTSKPSNFQTLESVARHFRDRIAFIHVRDVEGTKEDFTELFHDQGTTDQFALMRLYREIGLDVPVRGDHVPEMAYDRELTPEGTPGYFTLGRLFANGFLQALLKGTEAP